MIAIRSGRIGLLVVWATLLVAAPGAAQQPVPRPVGVDLNGRRFVEAVALASYAPDDVFVPSPNWRACWTVTRRRSAWPSRLRASGSRARGCSRRWWAAARAVRCASRAGW